MFDSVGGTRRACAGVELRRAHAGEGGGMSNLTIDMMHKVIELAKKYEPAYYIDLIRISRD